MTGRETTNKQIRRMDNLAKVLQMSKAMQTRFELIPESALNRVTVAGIRDMSLGRVKNGKPVGANVIRVNNPSPGTQSDFHRICIDPNGFSNRANPHIAVSPGTVAIAQKLQKVLQVTGRQLFVISLLAAAVRVGKTVYDELTIDDEIDALEEVVRDLTEDLHDGSLSGDKLASFKDALAYSENLLKEARYSKEHTGEKVLQKIVCVGGEFCGAAIGGMAGSRVGMMIGVIGGPVGIVVGTVVGSIVGAAIGHELGGRGSSELTHLIGDI